jgi:hypothetical protein
VIDAEARAFLGTLLRLLLTLAALAVLALPLAVWKLAELLGRLF